MDLPKRYAAVFVALGALAALVPVLFVLHAVGGLSHWQGVLPKGTTDSTYYYARVHEVVDGHPLIGNPYAYEHHDALPPAQFVPDVLIAVPALIGIPFDIAMAFNVALWAAAFLILACMLLRSTGVGRRWAALFAVVSYASAYSFMLRPVVMQVVYPSLLLFLLALSLFMQEQSRRRMLLLALATAATYYVYTFLFYVAVLTLGAVFVGYLATRRFAELRALVYAGLGAIVLIIPGGVLTVLQMHDPNYLATFVRIGLVHTHLPSAESFLYGRWIVAAGLAAGVLWYAFSRGNAAGRYALWLTSAIGFVAALFLNVATGVELTLGVHIGRLAIPWLPLALGALVWDWWAVKGQYHIGRRKQIAVVVGGVLVLAVAVGVVTSVPRGFDFFKFDRRGQTTAAEQAYAAPLKWLEQHVPQQSVVLADDGISTYIPIMTRHYPLFELGAGLHDLSDHELLERYLLSRSLGQESTQDLKRDFDLYTGAGAGLAVVAQQESYRWCTLLSHIAHRTCAAPQDAVTQKGDAYFVGLLTQFAQVKKDRAALLAQYHVSYVLVDTARDQWPMVPLGKAVYDDGRFAIVPVAAL